MVSNHSAFTPSSFKLEVLQALKDEVDFPVAHRSFSCSIYSHSTERVLLPPPWKTPHVSRSALTDISWYPPVAPPVQTERNGSRLLLIHDGGIVTSDRNYLLLFHCDVFAFANPRQIGGKLLPGITEFWGRCHSGCDFRTGYYWPQGTTVSSSELTRRQKPR